MPAELITLTTSAAEPVMVVEAVTSTATLVTPSTVNKSAAAEDASVTVTVNALLLLAFVSVVSVARAPSVIVAVTIPVVSPSRMFDCATDAVPLSTVAA